VSVPALSRLERRIRMLLVADHEVVRLGLRSALETSRWFDVVADVGTMTEAVTAAVLHRPALVLIAGGRSDGPDIDGCDELRARAQDARIVILGEHVEAPTALLARVGAIGSVSRQLGARSLCRALRELVAGDPPPLGQASPPAQSRRDGPARDVLALTAQERRVLELVAHGKTNKEIGTALGLSAKTVKNYLSNAFEKLNVSRRAEAAVLFIKGHGWRSTS
jgi:two-component system, NarL family, response regulator DevR